MSQPTLKELNRRAGAAQKKFTNALEARLRPGMGVWVTTGYGETYYETYVEVIRTSGDRVEVRNPVTERRYWVYASRLLEFGESYEGSDNGD